MTFPSAVLYNKTMLPKDPYVLFSAVNMKLRDSGLSLAEFCEEEEIAIEEVTQKLAEIGYIYDENSRKFVAK